jgi:hypothetical protein
MPIVELNQENWNAWCVTRGAAAPVPEIAVLVKEQTKVVACVAAHRSRFGLLGELESYSDSASEVALRAYRGIAMSMGLVPLLLVPRQFVAAHHKLGFRETPFELMGPSKVEARAQVRGGEGDSNSGPRRSAPTTVASPEYDVDGLDEIVKPRVRVPATRPSLASGRPPVQSSDESSPPPAEPLAVKARAPRSRRSKSEPGQSES